jgi:hypothetical protein
MEIKTLADLSKIAALCRKKGIETIKISADSVEFKLAEERPKQRRSAKTSDKGDPEAIPQFTKEDALFWSVNQIPAGDA